LRAFEEYLRSLYYDRSSGEAVRETSYYGALQNLLNTAGEELRPQVRAIVNIRNRGAGIPDGGLFTADQYERGLGDEAMQAGQLPARGAIEVKGVEEEVTGVVRKEQVERYLDRYGQVLTTTYRAFLLVGRGPTGQAVTLDSYTIAPTKEAFWELASRPRQTAAEQGERFMDFLSRALLYGAPLTRPDDLARFLAHTLVKRSLVLRLDPPRISPHSRRCVQPSKRPLDCPLTEPEENTFFDRLSCRRSSMAYSQLGFYGVSRHNSTTLSHSIGALQPTL